MKQLYLFPPNYRAINKAFNVRGQTVWFCYGPVIYNPSRVVVPAPILAHERVHSAQQGTDPAQWWDRYIADREFRLSQEIPAHRAEYGWWVSHGDPGERMLDTIAMRLASPLYGKLIDFEAARRTLAAAPDGDTTTSNNSACQVSTAPATRSI